MSVFRVCPAYAAWGTGKSRFLRVDDCLLLFLRAFGLGQKILQGEMSAIALQKAGGTRTYADTRNLHPNQAKAAILDRENPFELCKNRSINSLRQANTTVIESGELALFLSKKAL